MDESINGDGDADGDITMDREFLVFGKPQFEQAEIDEIVDCLRTGWVGTGPKVKRFEADFVAFMGSGEAAAVGSCTAGLQLAIKVLDLPPEAEIITTPFTFCASVNAILHAGARPVLADVDPFTANIDPSAIEAQITPRTAAIMPVHMAGRPCEMDRIMAMAQQHGLRVVEDCAHALETVFHGTKAGAFGDMGVFSFYATKNVATGEGGMVVSHDQTMMARIRTLSLHGLSADAWSRFSDAGYKHYLVEEAGYKYNMIDLQAALGIHQLARVEYNWLRRQDIWRRYMLELSGLPVVLPAPVAPDTRHAHHLFSLFIRDEAPVTRDDFIDEMTKRRIGVGVHYLSMPEQPFYQNQLDWRPENWPIAADLGRRTVSLPLTPYMTNDEVDRVVTAVHEILRMD